jgi:hypothetical protein
MEQIGFQKRLKGDDMYKPDINMEGEHHPDQDLMVKHRKVIHYMPFRHMYLKDNPYRIVDYFNHKELLDLNISRC